MESGKNYTPFQGIASRLKKKYGTLFDPTLLDKRPQWKEISKKEFLKDYYALHDSLIIDYKKYKNTLYFLFKYDNHQSVVWIPENVPFGELKLTGVKEVKFFRTDKSLNKKSVEPLSARRLFPMSGELVDGFLENFDKSIYAIISHRDTFTRKFTESGIEIKFSGKPRFFFRSWETKEKISIKKILAEVAQEALKRIRIWLLNKKQ